MRSRKSTTAKPLHASRIRHNGSATNWEKARDVHHAQPQRKNQVRGDRAAFVSPKKVKKTREVRRKRGRKANAADSSGDNAVANFISGETSMDAELRSFAQRVALSSKERQLRTRVFNDVKDLISSAFQDATVQLYGSSSTGLDTFRSDLDITVGGITLSSSQPLPTVVLVDEDEDDGDADNEDMGVGVEDVRDAQPDEEESSFSLNLALPVGTVASVDNADITRRVQPTAASHWNPTLRRRKLRALRALQFLLKSQRPHFQVKCLHKAKIPILMVLDTKTKLSIDIGVNGEAFDASEHGRSTSLAQRLQNTLGAPFTTMVMFLKEFLHQFDLDKPFTGGLGSFRLYMMVAYIFQRSGSKRKKKRQTAVSSLLLAFFELFGNKKTPKFLHEDTQLPLPLGDGGHMDFGGVFRIDDCVDTFAMAFDILSSTGNLGSIIYEERLEKDRKKSEKNLEQTS
ncbi:Terminal nucleotidyltransferase 4B [Phytophthora ramorum]|uniref:Poly(A) RNA polymerase mitochondrial-like central palm domain-containing protein n=1 Tax=Phytophthora ramorum TaxID=164328 RepID=H3H389_PHYRM|nr:Terminal nucleotidyltransferase 4B [Phytophthora ramorum]